jgi:toxin ParE1/3/4
MTAIMLASAERDLEQAFDYYDAAKQGLGDDFLIEFRSAVDRILTHPAAWQRMNETYRRCTLHRFPYGIMYRVDEAAQQIIITTSCTCTASRRIGTDQASTKERKCLLSTRRDRAQPNLTSWDISEAGSFVRERCQCQ